MQEGTSIGLRGKKKDVLAFFERYCQSPFYNVEPKNAVKSYNFTNGNDDDISTIAWGCAAGFPEHQDDWYIDSDTMDAIIALALELETVTYVVALDYAGVSKRLNEAFVTYYPANSIQPDYEYPTNNSKVVWDILIGTDTIESESGWQINKNRLVKYTGLKTEVVIPNSITVIGKDAFKDKKKLTEITFPDGLIEIEESAFSGCESLKNIKLPESVEKLGDGCFEKCKSIIEVVLPDKTINWGSWIFSGCSNLSKINISRGVTVLDDTFYYCSSLKSIEIPDSVQSIGESAFTGCSELTDIVIPGNVKSIGPNSFAGCSKLKTFIALEGVKEIYTYTFHDCKALTSLVLPASVKKIDDDTFPYDFPEDLKIYAPSGSRAEKYALKNKIPFEDKIITSLSEIPKSKVTVPEDGFVIDGNKLKRYKGTDTEIIIPDGITEISNKAFMDCDTIEKIVIPNEVIKIGNSAFYGCENLQTVTLNEGLEHIGEEAFYRCDKLKSIEIPSTLKNGRYAFGNCKNLKKVVIKNGLKIISNGMFCECEKITSVEIPPSVTIIENSAFSQCKGLVQVKLNQGLKSIGVCAFECKKLISIEIPSSVKKIGTAAFLSSTTIHAPASSYAEQYAKENDINFEAM